MKIICLIFILTLVSGCNRQKQYRTTWDDLRYAKLRVLYDHQHIERPVILVSTDHTSELSCTVLAAVWQCGRIVWSKDQLKGGQPYLQANISKNKVASFLSDLEDKKYFSDIYLNYPELGASVTSLIISIYEKRPSPNMEPASLRRILTMESAHEYHPELKEKQRSKKYLRKWGYLRDKISGLIPDNGEPVNFDYRIGFAPLFEPDKVGSYILREQASASSE